MTAVPHSPTPYPKIVRADGQDMLNGKNGVTLATGTVYFVLIGGDAALVTAFHLQWDAAIIMEVSVQDACNPDASVTSSTAGEWVNENPTNGYIGGDGEGGMTATGLTADVAGGTAGGAMWHLGNTGALLTRIRIEVAGTGGVVKATTHAKM